MTQFIAIDGEGYTNSEGTHIYNLLAASDKSFIADNDGLDTEDCFEYLIGLRNKFPGGTFVSFYFSYDVNMILKDLAFELVDLLRTNGFCYAWVDSEDNDKPDCYYGYKIEYFPRKMFRIQKGYRDFSTGSRKFVSETTITVWDVFGFFQSGFVKALSQFDIGSEDELKLLQSMKEQRSNFDINNFDSILEYNNLECKLLVDLMGKLDTSLQTCGIFLDVWNGAGAVAAALLHKYDLKFHISQPTGTHELPVHSAYFGGRIQALQVGIIDAPVFGHDLVSAYPSTLRYLPSLKNCTQIIVDGSDYYPSTYPIAVWRVSWRVPHDTPVCPFPFRMPDGAVEYPSAGSGYYWTPEVETAIKWFGRDCIDVELGYAFIPSDEYIDFQPFSFINVLFEERKRFKAEGNHAQLCVKLGLNSLYGKTAQGIGYNKTRPAYQSYIYAGLVTAGTRARMLDLAMTRPDSIICFCTDGVYSTVQLSDDSRDRLGGWECETYDNMFILKAGFYTADKNGKRLVSRLRGFRSDEVSWDVMRQEWLDNGVLGSCTFPCRNFIGMKGSHDLSTWRCWIDSSKTLSFMPGNGFPDLVTDNPPLYRISSSSYAGSLSAKYDVANYSNEFYFGD